MTYSESPLYLQPSSFQSMATPYLQFLGPICWNYPWILFYPSHTLHTIHKEICLSKEKKSFIYFFETERERERERERAQVSKEQRKRGREREGGAEGKRGRGREREVGLTRSEALVHPKWSLSSPHAGLKLTNRETMTRAEVRCLTDWATQALSSVFHLMVLDSLMMTF